MTTHPDNPKPLQYNFFDADLWKARIDSIDDAIDATFKLFYRSLPTLNGLSINKLKQVIRDASGVHINLDEDEPLMVLTQPNNNQAQAFIQWTMSDAKLRDMLLTAPLATVSWASEKNKTIKKGDTIRINIQEIQNKIDVTVDIYRPDTWVASFTFDISDKKNMETIEFVSDADKGEVIGVNKPGDAQFENFQIQTGDKITMTRKSRGFLPSLLQTLSNSLPQDTSQIGWSADFDFEAKQMLNLYMLTNTINNFFWVKLKSVMEDTLDSHPTQLPPVHLIRDCFRELTTDVEIIQNAIIQRMWAIDTNKNTFPSAQAKSLIVMDKLALLSLAPIQHLLSDDSSITPISYISQKTQIRQIPYTKQVLLISVAYDRISLPVNKRAYGDTKLDEVKELPAFELMAIPHEVAHYLYNHTSMFQKISTNFKENPYYHWCEELFADIYGCIVTGPLTAIGLQAMLATGNKDRVWKDDEEHPTPIIRPYILTEILRMLNDKTINTAHAQKYNFTKVADALDANWTAILQRWGFELTVTNTTRPTLIKIHDNSQAHVEQYVNVTNLLQGVKPIATEFIKQLMAVVKLNPWQSDASDDVRINFPCCQENESTATDYYAEMINLTNHEFASKQIPSYLLSKTYLNYDRIQAPTPEEILQNCLDHWGEKGPHGWGDHG